MLRTTIFFFSSILSLSFQQAQAWGREGHETIGFVAQRFLEPKAARAVDVLLSGDRSGLTPDTTLPSETVWADAYRDSTRLGGRGRNYNSTKAWHYMDPPLGIGRADLAPYCMPSTGNGFASMRLGGCVMSKVREFADELRNPSIPVEERRLALQYLLHLVGDLHQPLHVASNGDAGGNGTRIVINGRRMKLHAAWDSYFLGRLGNSSEIISRTLISEISREEVAQWVRGNERDWASETHQLAEQYAYDIDRFGDPSQGYEPHAIQVTKLQIKRAGVRLAALLNEALAGR